MSGIESAVRLERRVEELEKQVAELERYQRQVEAYIRLEIAKAQRPQPHVRVKGLIRPRGESQ